MRYQIRLLASTLRRWGIALKEHPWCVRLRSIKGSTAIRKHYPASEARSKIQRYNRILYRWILSSIALLVDGYMTVYDDLGRMGILFKKLNSLIIDRRPKRWIKDLFLPNKACRFFVIIENRLFAICKRRVAHQP